MRGRRDAARPAPPRPSQPRTAEMSAWTRRSRRPEGRRVWWTSWRGSVHWRAELIMTLTRRDFLSRTSAGAAALPLFPQARAASDRAVPDEALEQAAARPVLDTAAFKSPVVLDSVQLLRKGREHFVRVRSKDGAEGLAVDNGRADVLHPIFTKLVAPYFVGKDARELEDHLFGVYRDRD